MATSDSTTEVLDAIKAAEAAIVAAIVAIPVPPVVPDATETVKGIAELATQAETDAGTDDLKIVTPLKLKNTSTVIHSLPAASETVSGIAELATTTETNTGTDDTRIVTPLKLAGRTATEARTGIAELATQAETDAGTDDTRMVTPLKFKTSSLRNSFALQGVAMALNPADSANYQLGSYSNPTASTTFNASNKMYIPKAGSIRAAYVSWDGTGVAGSGENISIYVRLNNTTDTLIATVGNTNQVKTFSNTALAIAVALGDYIELKITCPVWATNPANVNIYFTLFIN